MQLTIKTTTGDYCIQALPDDDAMDLAREYRERDQDTMTFDMDGATIIIDRYHIVALELDPS